MSHDSGSLEEISYLLTDHKSFSGDHSLSSEMFSPSNERIVRNNNLPNEKSKVGYLISGEEHQDDVQLESLQTQANSPLLAGFAFDSPTSAKCSILKSHRFSESRREISTRSKRSISSSKSQHRSSLQPIATDQSSLSLTPEKLNSMDESQLRESLQKSLLDNSSLLEEVQIKDKTIRRLTECLNDIQVFSSSRGHPSENIPRFDFQRPSIGSGDNNSELIDCEEQYCLEKLGLTNQLCVFSSEIIDGDKENILNTQESKTSLFEEFSIAIRESRPALEQNVITGTYIAKDILVGGSLGWLGAYLLRKFGTTALTAITGGFVVIHLAARKGYVIVNWGEIYKEIEKQSEENEEIKNEMEWIGDKVNEMKGWIQQHKYIAGGLAVSFIYKIFK